MKFTREAKANWNGNVKDGSGNLTTDSKVLENTPYSFSTRFEDAKGTNPEELIAAAHAGCFTMQLSALLTEADYKPTNLDTVAKLDFEDKNVKKIHLNVTGSAEGIDEDTFVELAQKAKKVCPISKLLNTEIELTTNFG